MYMINLTANVCNINSYGQYCCIEMNLFWGTNITVDLVLSVWAPHMYRVCIPVCCRVRPKWP